MRIPGLIVTLAGSILAAPAGAADDAITVRGLDVFHDGATTELFIETSQPPTFRAYSKEEPPVLIVDLVGTQGSPAAVEQPGGVVRSLEFDDLRSRSGPIARLTLRFTKQVRYDVSAERNLVRVTIIDDGAKAQSAKPGPKLAMNERTRPGFATDAAPLRLAQEGTAGASTDDGSEGEGANKMTYIGFNDRGDSSRVFARLNSDTAKYEVKKEGDTVLVLEIQDTSIPLRNNKNHLDATFFESPVKMITPSEVDDSPPMVRITIEMKENVPYEEKREGKEISIYFKK